MIPALTECGRSFKGAAAYYLHDKRQSRRRSYPQPGPYR